MKQLPAMTPKVLFMHDPDAEFEQPENGTLQDYCGAYNAQLVLAGIHIKIETEPTSLMESATSRPLLSPEHGWFYGRRPARI